MNKAERGNAGSHWELNPGPMTLVTSALTTELQQPYIQPSALHNSTCTCIYTCTARVILNASVVHQAATMYY